MTNKMPLVLPDDDGIRPAGPKDACFYCQKKVGDPHDSSCVILNRKVRLKYIFEVESEVPWGWEEDYILFHRINSWCADNAIDELDDIREKSDSCLCDIFTCELIEIPDAEPYRRNKKGDVVP